LRQARHHHGENTPNEHADCKTSADHGKHPRWVYERRSRRRAAVQARTASPTRIARWCTRDRMALIDLIEKGAVRDLVRALPTSVAERMKKLSGSVDERAGRRRAAVRHDRLIVVEPSPRPALLGRVMGHDRHNFAGRYRHRICPLDPGRRPAQVRRRISRPGSRSASRGEESPGSMERRCRITSGGGDPRDSATESRPPCRGSPRAR
jgi:hypothetical protein